MKQVLRVRFEPAHENLINKLGQGREQKMFFLQASLRKGVSPKERAERNEAAINSGHSFCSYLKKRVWVRAEFWAPLAESARTASFAQTTANWCPRTSSVVSTYIKIICYLFPFGRAVRLSQTRERGATLLPLPRYLVYCFSRTALNLRIRFP